MSDAEGREAPVGSHWMWIVWVFFCFILFVCFASFFKGRFFRTLYPRLASDSHRYTCPASQVLELKIFQPHALLIEVLQLAIRAKLVSCWLLSPGPHKQESASVLTVSYQRTQSSWSYSQTPENAAIRSSQRSPDEKWDAIPRSMPYS